MERSPPESAGPDEATPARRGFFRWLSVGMGAIASAFVGLPVVGYLLKPKERPAEWVVLGRVEDFAVNETRMLTFENPIRQPWDGMAAHTGVYVRYEGKDDRAEGPVPGPRRQLSPTWVVRSPGSRNRGCSCVPAMAVSTTPPASAPRGRRRGGCFTASGAVERRAARGPRLRTIRPCRTP